MESNAGCGDDAVVFAFGDAAEGKLGVGEFTPESSEGLLPGGIALPPVYRTPTRLKTLQKEAVHFIACGPHNSAFLTASGAVLVCGGGLSSHESTVLADPIKESALVPLAIPRGPLSSISVKQIALGNYHAALLTKTGYVYSWGWGHLGQLGHGDWSNVLEPKQIRQLTSVKQIATGTKYTVALSLFGEVFAWGENEKGQLGVGSFQKQASPVRIKKLHNASHIAAGASHTVAVAENTVWLWGQTTVSGKVQSLPMEVEPLASLGVHQIACGSFHTLALTLFGQVYEWKVGDSPTPVLGALQGHIVRTIACGSFHSLALTHSGKMFAWGRNKNGQLGYVTEGSLATSATSKNSSPRASISIPAAATSDNSPHLVTFLKANKNRPGGKSMRRLAPSTSTASVGDGLDSSSDSNPPGPGQPILAPPPASKNTARQPVKYFVSQISAGEFHSLAVVERDPKRLAVWQMVRKERLYVMKLRTVVEMYLVALERLVDSGEDPAAPPATPPTPYAPGATASVLPTSVVAEQLYSPVASTIAQNKLRAAASVNFSLSLQLAQLRGDASAVSFPDKILHPHRSADSKDSKSPTSPSSKDSAANASSPSRNRTLSGTISSSSLSGSPGAPDNLASSRAKKLTMNSIRAIVADITFDRVVASVFSNIIQIYELHLQFLAELDAAVTEAMQGGDPISTLVSVFTKNLGQFGVYLFYADQYPEAAYYLHLLHKNFPAVSACLKTQQDLANLIYQRPDKPGYRDFSLKALLIEPLKQIAIYVFVLKKIKELVRPPSEAVNQLVEHMNGLLERVCKNFNFVDPMEILTSSLDERGFPQIGGGTVEQLVQRLTHHQFIDIEFTNAFLFTYRLFTTSSEVLKQLVQRFKVPPPATDPLEDHASHLQNVHRPIQQRVVHTLVTWITSPLCAYDWDAKDSALQKEIATFLQDLAKEDEYKHHAAAIQNVLNRGTGNVIKLTSAASAAKGLSVAVQGGAVDASLKDKNVVMDQSAEALALAIAQADVELFKGIQPRELLGKSFSLPAAKFEEVAPNLFKVTKRFNALGVWVAYEVIKPEQVKERLQIFQTFVEVSQKLVEMRDFNSALAVLGGLNNASVGRLKKTFAKLPTKASETLLELNELLSGKENYRTVRRLWSEAEPPAIPMLVIATKDLTFIEDGNPDKLENGGINFYKWRKVSEVVHDILQYKDFPYLGQSNPEIGAYFNVASAEAIALGEEGLYRLSKKRE